MTIVFPIYLYNNTTSPITLYQINRTINPNSYFAITNERELFNIYLTSKDFEQQLTNGDLKLVKNNLNAEPDPGDEYTPTEAIAVFSLYKTVTNIGPFLLKFETFTNQTSIVVNHGLNYMPMVQVLDDANEVMIPLSIIHDSTTQFTVNFSALTSGTLIYI